MASNAIKLTRFATNESREYGQDNPRFSVTVPEQVGMTDPSQGKLVLRARLYAQDPAGQEVPYPVVFGSQQTNASGSMYSPYDATALIRNTRVTSRNGYHGERRRANLIDANREWYTSGTNDKSSMMHGFSSENYSKLRTRGDRNNCSLPIVPWFNYNRPNGLGKDSNAPAVANEAEIELPLSCVDPLFRDVSMMPHQAFGDMDIKVELEDQIDVVANWPCLPVNIAGEDESTGTQWPKQDHIDNKVKLVTQYADAATAEANSMFYNGMTVEIIYTKGATVVKETGQVANIEYTGGTIAFNVTGSTTAVDTTSTAVTKVTVSAFNQGNPIQNSCAPALVACNNSNAATFGTAAFPLVETAAYSSDEDVKERLPFYVGCPVHVGYVQSGSSAEVYDTIAAISVSAAGVASYTMTSMSIDGSTNAISAVKISMLNRHLQPRWKISEAYIQLPQHILPASSEKQQEQLMKEMNIPFYAEQLLSRSLPSATTVQDTVNLQPMCCGVAVLTPQTGLLSGRENVVDYRLAIDGQQMTNRPVPIGAAQDDAIDLQLHYASLKLYFANVGRVLKKYNKAPISAGTGYDDVRADRSIVAAITPRKPVLQVFNMTLDGGATAIPQQEYFYVQSIAKAVIIKDGRLQVV